jgi:hypothetical protein
MDRLHILKSLSQIAMEFNFIPRTFYNHIQRHEILRANIQRGLQPPKLQKLIYDTLGYPPGVNKSDYDNV